MVENTLEPTWIHLQHRGLHERAVGILNADGVGSGTLFDYVGVDGEEVVCTTGVGNSCSNW